MVRLTAEVLGVAVDFESNAEAVLDAVAAWPDASMPAESEQRTRPPRVPRIRLLLGTDPMQSTVGVGPHVSPRSHSPVTPAHVTVNQAARLAGHDLSAPVVFRTPAPGRLAIEGPGFRGHADAGALTAECVLAAAVLDSRERFHETVVATLALFLVTRLDRQPFHAAAIGRDGLGLLLAGPSGTGKSTLAYAAQRAGWTVFSDDAVYLQQEPALRVWSRCAPLHPPPNAARWFPELAGRTPERRENGKLKYAIERPVQDITPPPLEHAVLCLLERSTGEAESHRLDPEDAVERSLRDLDAGFDVFRPTIGPALSMLAQNGAWLVRTGADPHSTVPILAGVLGRTPNYAPRLVVDG